MPESPRWLFVNGKEKAAMAVVTKYHGMGGPKSSWVTLQEQQYRTSLNRDGAVVIPTPFKQHDQLLTLIGQTLVGISRDLS